MYFDVLLPLEAVKSMATVEVELASSLDVVKEGELRLDLGCCQENEARILVVFLLFLLLGVDDLQRKFEE